MKLSLKGILTLSFFLVIIPVLADTFVMTMLPHNGPVPFALTKILLIGYAWLTPLYLVYLLIAFTVLKYLKKYRNRKH